MISIQLKKKQGRFTLDTAFATDSHGITGLFGPSGSGKTTLVNMVAGLTTPDQGHIRIKGNAVYDSAKKICLPPEKRGVGYVFQESRLFPHLDVTGNMTFGMKRKPESCRYIRFEPVVELLGIGHFLDRRPATLSGGEKQRVAIGRAILSSPRLLLMDEPLASLDQARKEEILPYIKSLSQEFGVPILYVSHSREEISYLADCLVMLSSGIALAEIQLGKEAGMLAS